MSKGKLVRYTITKGDGTVIEKFVDENLAAQGLTRVDRTVKVFEGLEVKKKPIERFPLLKGDKRDYLCPVCQGYGQWIYGGGRDKYGEGRHAMAHCSQCNGWGWVDEQSRDCIHEDYELTQREARAQGQVHFGMCYHVYKCKHCGRYNHTDSSG